MRKQFFLRWMLMLLYTYSASVSFAQTKTVSGIITDSSGEPLSQATVKAKNKTAPGVFFIQMIANQTSPAPYP